MTTAAGTLKRAGDPVTVIQAYRAMIAFLHARWEWNDKDGNLSSVLGDISLDIWTDGSPGDPASWDEWLTAIDRVD